LRRVHVKPSGLVITRSPATVPKGKNLFRHSGRSSLNDVSRLPTMPYNNIVKLTPFRLVGLLNPGIELSYERAFHRTSTQITGTYLLSRNLYERNLPIHPQIKGFQVGIEERFYWAEFGPRGPT